MAEELSSLLCYEASKSPGDHPDSRIHSCNFVASIRKRAAERRTYSSIVTFSIIVALWGQSQRRHSGLWHVVLQSSFRSMAAVAIRTTERRQWTDERRGQCHDKGLSARCKWALEPILSVTKHLRRARSCKNHGTSQFSREISVPRSDGLEEVVPVYPA